MISKADYQYKPAEEIERMGWENTRRLRAENPDLFRVLLYTLYQPGPNGRQFKPEDIILHDDGTATIPGGAAETVSRLP